MFFCLEDFLFRQINKQQITDLILISNENNIHINREDYMMNVYAKILIFFENLTHLTILPSSNNNNPVFSLRNLSPTTFASSTLTNLCINMFNFESCLALLDGRLKQLTTLIVQVSHFDDEPSISYNHVSLYSMIHRFLTTVRYR